MADGDSLRGRLAAFLAPSQDNNVSPQARDEDPTTVGREEFREEADAQDIAGYVEEYYRNPLVRVPVQNFAADVTEPGVSVTVDTPDDTDVPTVPESARQYTGMALDDALEQWLSSSYIDGFSFDADVGDLLQEMVKDRRGRRGTSMVEHAYDDPRERERLMGLRPLKVETTTAYTREGKRIALRPDDEPGSFDTVAIHDLGDYTRDKAPQTPAGKTAAIAQFDEVFGSEDREEIPFALDDLTISAYDADTGQLFGEPDSATIINRAKSLRKKLRHVDQSVVNTAFGNVIAQVDSESEDVVKAVRDNLDVNVKDRGDDADPDSVSVTNAPVDISEVDASVPQITDHIQQEIEFVLAAMPTPLYRVGFAGDINRDVTAEQGEDYRDAVKRERRRLESDLQPMLAMKAGELLHGDAHADESLEATPRLRIRPADSESPLRDEEFDANDFSQLMSGLSTAAGPKGGATAILPEEVIVDTVLDMDADEVLGDDEPAPDAAPAGQASAAVQEAFEEFSDADLAGGPFADIPVLPDDLQTLSQGWLIRWAEWVAAGRPDIPESERLTPVPYHAALDWNPELHPRDPETGQFVERPFSVPDDAPDFGDQSVAETLQYLDDNGADVSAILDPDSSVTVDGVPNDATSLDEIPVDSDEANPEPTDSEPDSPSDWASLDHDGFAEAYDRDVADDKGPLIFSDADAGATASAMEIELLPDGTEAYVTNYGDGPSDPDGLGEVGEADPELYEREAAAYRFLRATENDGHISPHAFAGEEGGRAWSASLEAPGESAWNTESNVDRGAYIDAAAAQLIAGNNDLHGQNIRVTEDGDFEFIDIDHSAGRLDEPDPGESFADNRTRALEYLSSTGSNVVEDEDGLSEAIEERAREKALALDEGDGGFEPETPMEENIAANIRQLADEARSPGTGDGSEEDENDGGSGGGTGDTSEPPTDADADDLPDVRGLGTAIADSLRAAGFTTSGDIRTASIDELEAVDGVGPTLAGRLKDAVSDDADNTVSVSESARADAQAALASLPPDAPTSPEQVAPGNTYQGEPAPLLTNTDAASVWDGLREQATTDDERAAVSTLENKMMQMKGTAYTDTAQSTAKTFDEALGGLPGNLRNDLLDGDDPTDAEVWAAERVTAAHQQLAERLYGDSVDAYRGVRGFGAAQVAIGAISQLSDEENVVSVSENKFANYTPSESLARDFEEGFVFSREIDTEDIVHFNDMTNAAGSYKDEAEVAPATGDDEFSAEQIELTATPDADTDAFLSGDVDEMGDAELQSWMDTLENLANEQARERSGGETDEPIRDLYQEARQGADSEALNALNEILTAAAESDSATVTPAATSAVDGIMVAGDS